MKKKTWPVAAEREFWAAACAPGAHPDSLWWFIRIAWGAEWYLRGTGEVRWLAPRIHKPFLRWFSNLVLSWKAQRRAGKLGRWVVWIILPRGFGKSVCITKSASVWAQLDEPNMTAYIGSETDPKAQAFLAPIKEVISGRDPYAWFRHLYGNWYDRTRAWSEDRVVHRYRKALGFSEPSFGTYSVTKGITGYHPLWVVLDDPTSKETMSESTLLAARDSYDSTYPALRTDSMFIGVMTRYAANDCTGHAIEQDGIADWAGMPSTEYAMTTEGRIHVYFLQGRNPVQTTDESPEGVPVLPEVWDEDGLRRYKKRDPINYAAQIMNTPSIGEHMPLDRSQIDQLWIDRDDLPPIEYATLHLDCAFSDERRIAEADASVIVTALHDIRDNGLVYIEHVYRNTLARSNEFITALISRLLTLRGRGIRVKCITDEKTIGGHAGLWKQTLETAITAAGLRCPEIIILNRGGTKKATRIRAAAGYWAEGYVRLIRGAEGIEHLVNEMLNIDRAPHDDVSDAAADIWQEDVWRRPHDHRSRDEGAIPIQPGDEEGLRGVRRLVLTGDALQQRIDDIFPSGLGRRVDFDDDPPGNNPI